MKNLEFLKPVDSNLNIKRSGIPYCYDDKNIYINDSMEHTLVIGTTGSGKTQSVTLPQLKLAIAAGESLILNDPKGELYKETANLLKDKGYKTMVINIQDTLYSNNWNPLSLPYELYKKGDKDKAVSLIEDVAYYIFEYNKSNEDPFWRNSAINYFVGLVLYLFENAKEDEININSVYVLGSEIDKLKEEVNKLSKISLIYINLSSILFAPVDTQGGIISVFKQLLNLYVGKESLSNLLSNNDYNLIDFVNNKFALFVISGAETYNYKMIPLVVSQMCTCLELREDKSRVTNVILDEFEYLTPIRNFNTFFLNSRSQNIRFTVLVRSFIDLDKTYGDNADVLKMCFSNLIYLLANDLDTLKRVCEMCGESSNISIDDLRTLKMFESVILVPREKPFRTKLLPDYQIPWPFKVDKDANIEKRNVKDIKIFEIKKS